MANLKFAIRVLQLNVPLAFRYSLVYQKVQSSTGSTVMALYSPQRVRVPVCEPVPLMMVFSASMVLEGSAGTRPVNAIAGFVVLLETL